MLQYTAGPWECDEWGNVTAHGELIARVSWCGGRNNESLIAAAPELYEALEDCLDCLGDEHALPSDVIDEARNALAKVEGRKQ